VKTDLSYLPQHKQDELNRIVKTIQDIVPVEMVILFGSYARNDWVEDKYDETQYRYQSDMDILVMIHTDREAIKMRYECEIEHKIDEDESIKTPVSIIVHSVACVNRRLRKGQYFFSDIKKEGILLVDSQKYQLDEAKELSPAERKKLAQEDFDYYFRRVDSFLKIVDFCMNDNELNNAAFLLHQAAERLYNGILLVFTHYKPKTHDMEILRKLTYSVSNELLPVFPLDTPENRHLFKLLRKAYIEARYKRNYSITKDELTQLIKHVADLREVGQRICIEKIASF